MDTSKNTVTLPAEDYQKMKTWYESKIGVVDRLKCIHEITEDLIKKFKPPEESPVITINGLSEAWKYYV